MDSVETAWFRWPWTTYFTFASCHVTINHHDTLHVTSHTKPSCFSAWNIEKLKIQKGQKHQSHWQCQDWWGPSVGLRVPTPHQWCCQFFLLVPSPASGKMPNVQSLCSAQRVLVLMKWGGGHDSQWSMVALNLYLCLCLCLLSDIIQWNPSYLNCLGPTPVHIQ